MARSYFTVLGMAAAVALGGCAMQQRGPGPGPQAGPGPGPGGGMQGGMMQGGMQGGGMMQGGMQGGGMMQGGMPMPGAMAKITPTQGNQANGVAVFHERDGRLMVHVRVAGLQPGSEHGFHIHERGDCSAPDATSAGGHFNPLGAQHGQPTSGERHAGDLPNLKANEQGNAEMRVSLAGLNLSGGQMSVLDRAVVIHAQPDDYRSQPAGNSGARIACGVISQAVPPPR